MSNVNADNPSALPRNWDRARVGDVLSLTNGFAFKPSHWKQQGSPIVRIQNLNNPDAAYNYCSDELPSKYRINRGDLLFAWSGTPGTSFGAHIWKGEAAWLNQHIFRVEFREELFDARFLRLAINANLADYIFAAHGGAGLAHITAGKFRESRLLVPPLAEQRRIVAEIEKQFTRLDAAVAVLKRVRANLKRYRAAVLKAACEGRFVPTEAELARKEGRSYETGEQLLARILKERRVKWEADQLAKMRVSGKRSKNGDWKKKYKEPEPPDSGNLPTLPEGWVWASIDQLSWFVHNGISTKPDSNAGLPILRISAVRPMKVDVTDIRFLPDAPEYSEYRLERGDLLFTRYNGTRELVGVCAVVPDGAGALAHPDKLIRVRAAAEHPLPAYLAIASNVGASRAFVEEKIRTTAGQSGVSGTDIRHIPIPLCPLAEQGRIVSEVEDRLSVLDSAHDLIKSKSERADHLRQSILKRAFEGKLVPQDPNDESASMLLEHIRAARGCARKQNVTYRQSKRKGNQMAKP